MRGSAHRRITPVTAVARPGPEEEARLPRTAAETRRHVLDVAHDLFHWEGIRATGIDRVASAAGVAPTTLYRHFESKDDLVAAYVDRASAQTREWISGAIDRAGPDPVRQVLALFDETLVRIQPDRCRGCAFLMTLAEFPDPELAAHELAVEAKAWVRERLGGIAGELAAAGSVTDPEVLADRLALVLDGLNATAQALGADGPALQARPLVELILADALAGPRAQVNRSTGPLCGTDGRGAVAEPR